VQGGEFCAFADANATDSIAVLAGVTGQQRLRQRCVIDKLRYPPVQSALTKFRHKKALPAAAGQKNKGKILLLLISGKFLHRDIYRAIR
jgi:hypothetical protein